MSAGTRSSSKSPIVEYGSERAASTSIPVAVAPGGGGRTLHGFSVSAPSEDVETVSALTAQKKRPREASLPSSGEKGIVKPHRAGGMRVILPGFLEGQNGVGSASSPDIDTQHEGGSGSGPGAAVSSSVMTCGRGSGSSSPGEVEKEEEMQSGEDSPPAMRKPETPLGRVVEPGQENTGRWTKEEHDAFLVGLQLYGKEWKKVAAKVKTRTVVQTRTHAQKYFQRLQKITKNSDEKGDIAVEMGTVSEAKKASPSGSSQKRKNAKRRPSLEDGFSSHVLQGVSAEAAAHLMAQMSSSASSLLMSASPSTTTFDQYADGHVFGQDPYRSFVGGDHFSDGTTSTVGFNANTPQSLASSMKIIAPAHDAAVKRGKFPEPSPAACGKRKLAEIAAAQMLAGVMTSGGGAAATASVRKAPPPPPPPEDPRLSGTATPPPPEGVDQADVSLTVSSSQKAGRRSSGGVSLQIVNPDALDEEEDSGVKRKKQHQGMPSPMTPWDGQLQTLVSDVQILKADESDGGASGFPGLPDLHSDDKTPAVKATPHLQYHPSDELQSRTTLHQAVCSASPKEVSELLGNLGTEEGPVNVQDEIGFFPLHSAAALCLHEMDTFGFRKANEIARFLLSAGADVSCCDACGNTPLHWAARVGNDVLTQTLLMQSCPLDAQNKVGETALHWALRSGSQGMSTARLLLQSGAKISTLNHEFKRPIDVAAKGFEDDVRAVEANNVDETRQARANLLANSPQSRTLVLHHSDCLDHIPKSSIDWEAPGRVESIMDRIVSQGAEGSTSALRSYEITISTDFDRAPLELLSRVHSAEYLQFVSDLSKELESRRKKEVVRDGEARNTGANTSSHHVVPFTPMVQRTVMREAQVKKGDHSDTSFSAGSLKAARRAAGAVQHAVDRVLVGRNRNAFCVVRPPGHHAGVNGLLAGGESCGFCIFNSVAAGAMHALSDESHRPRCERVAIVDIDAHHGNGTEEIIKKCLDPGRLFFFSVHIFDHDRTKGAAAYKFYPGTGDEDDVAHNIINVPLAPLWREKEVAAGTSASVAAAMKAAVVEPIQTRGRTRRRGSSSEASEKHPPGLSDMDTSSIDGSNASAKAGPMPRPAHYLLGTGRMAYRRAIQHRLLPSLRAFNPDLILISSGFDASRGDVGNARHYVGGKQRMGIDLEPDDYAWTTKKILEIADICCQGRVVSVLEGGYGRTPMRIPHAGVTAHPYTRADDLHQQLDKSVFAECAFRHIKALVDPFDDERRYPGSS